jgi:hypothetical protein
MPYKRTAVLFLLAVASAFAVPISFDYQLLGSYSSDGLQSLQDMGTYNGKPITSTNMPSDYERQLRATVNLYASPGAKNEVFFQVDDVVSTHFGFEFGSAFVNSTLTGFRFWLPASMVLNTPAFSSDYANPGERIMGPASGTSVPTDTTSGYDLYSNVTANAYSIHTPGYTDDLGFAEWGNVYGSRRIAGGGVFKLTFDPSVNLFSNFRWNELEMDMVYGNQHQFISAVYQSPVNPGPGDPNPVPEPGTSAMLGAGTACLAVAYRRRRS